MGVNDDWLRLIVTEMKNDISRIEAKVDNVLAFKWQLIGGGLVISAIITVAFQVLSLPKA